METIVALRGESDASTTTSLSDALSHVVAVDAGDVVIDLAALTFLDSATVRVLARLKELLAHHGRALTVRSPSRTADQILDLLGLTDLIEAPDAPKEEGNQPCTSESERSS